MPHVKSDGVNIWYDVLGDGDPLVLIGGNSLVHRQWDFLVPLLGDHFQIILYDQRGAGLSDRGSRGISVEQWVQDLRLVLDEVGIRKTHIFGTSSASLMVIRFAGKYPERTGAIIHYGMYKAGEQATKVTRIGAKVIEEFGTGRMGSYYLVRLFGVHPDYEDWIVRRFEENNSSESWKPMREALEIDLSGDLRTIQSPQMLLVGDRGPLGKDSDYGSGWKEVQRLCPGAEVVIIPDASGTVCVIEKPAEVAKHVIKFLNKHKIHG